ncbi:hypothetical protein QBC44DRAFT_13870 [Cladorrhinum sp. PSN332]|nr:hypothetical protein QBC44DRAFT_13870 [Cladorrhinum sp. PSN332]
MIIFVFISVSYFFFFFLISTISFTITQERKSQSGPSTRHQGTPHLHHYPDWLGHQSLTADFPIAPIRSINSGLGESNPHITHFAKPLSLSNAHLLIFFYFFFTFFLFFVKKFPRFCIHNRLAEVAPN